MTCRSCGRTLFPRYGDGDHVCAGCREDAAEDLDLGRFRRQEKEAPADTGSLRPADWQPVLGRVGGVGFGEGRKA